MRASGAEGGVGGGVHQVGERRGVGELDLDQPARAEGIAVDQFRGLAQGLVDRGDGAADGQVDVGLGLDRLDRAEGLAGRVARAHLRQIDVDDVRERVLRVIRDPDRRHLAFDADPLIALRILEISRDVHLGTP